MPGKHKDVDEPLDLELLQNWNPREQYTPLDQIGGPAAGGSAHDSDLPPQQKELLGRMDQRMASIQQLGQERSALENQLMQSRQEPQGEGFLSGLGRMGSQGLSALGSGLGALIPSQDTMMNGLNRLSAGLEAGGATLQGRTPLYVQLHQAARDNAFKQQQLDMQQDEMGMKRMQMAQQLQQKKIQQEEHQWKQLFDVFGNTNLTPPQQEEMLKQMAKQGHPMAFEAARTVNANMIADFKLVKDRLGMTPEEIMQGVQSGELNWHDLGAKIKVEKKAMEEETQALASENAQQRKMQSLIDRFKADPESLKDEELSLLEKHRDIQTERRMKIEKLRNELKGEGIDLAAKSMMPVVGQEVHLPGGRTQQAVFDPQTGKLSQSIGEKRPLVEVNTGTKASEEAAKKFMDRTAENYDRLRNVPDALQNIEEAKRLIPKAKMFMGPLGPSWLEGVKLLNNRLGTNIKAEGVKSAEELGSRIFFNLMDNLKKMDSQPSGEQQRKMEAALGNLGNDPNALGVMLDAYGDSLRRKVKLHNTEVDNAEKRDVRFPYEARVNIDDLPKTTRPSNTPDKQNGVPKITSKAEYDKLPSGTEYIAPDGKRKRKK
jgi:hypothetical protein